MKHEFMTTSSIKIEQFELDHFKDYDNHGMHINWFKNGHKRWEYEYQNDVLHGKVIARYHNNGRCYEIMNYIVANGQIVGKIE